MGKLRCDQLFLASQGHLVDEMGNPRCDEDQSARAQMELTQSEVGLP